MSYTRQWEGKQHLVDPGAGWVTKAGECAFRTPWAYVGKPPFLWRVAKFFFSAALDPPGIRFQSYPGIALRGRAAAPVVAPPSHHRPAFAGPCVPRALHYTLWVLKQFWGGQRNPTITEVVSRGCSWSGKLLDVRARVRCCATTSYVKYIHM